jgi:hypothetical protein
MPGSRTGRPAGGSGVTSVVTMFRSLSRRKDDSFILPKEDNMPSANRMTTPVAVDEPQIEGRYAVLGGLNCTYQPDPADNLDWILD